MLVPLSCHSWFPPQPQATTKPLSDYRFQITAFLKSSPGCLILSKCWEPLLWTSQKNLGVLTVSGCWPPEAACKLNRINSLISQTLRIISLLIFIKMCIIPLFYQHVFTSGYRPTQNYSHSWWERTSSRAQLLLTNIEPWDGQVLTGRLSGVGAVLLTPSQAR